MSYEQEDNADLLDFIQNTFLKDPQTYERKKLDELAKKGNSLAILPHGDEVNELDHHRIKIQEQELIRNLTKFKPGTPIPLGMYLDVETNDKKSIFSDCLPSFTIDKATIKPSFFDFSYYLNREADPLAQSLALPIQSKLSLGFHGDSQTFNEAKQLHEQNLSHFEFVTSYILREDMRRIIKVATIPSHFNDGRKNLIPGNTSENKVISPMNDRDIKIIQQSLSYMNATLRTQL